MNDLILFICNTRQNVAILIYRGWLMAEYLPYKEHSGRKQKKIQEKKNATVSWHTVYNQCLLDDVQMV